MTSAKDLSRLTDLAQLMLDHKLGTLRTSGDHLDQSRMQLKAINEAVQSADLEPVTSAIIEMSYQRWADVRRAELNLVIARQTADWLEARSDAQTAFGRVQALQGLAKSLRARQTKKNDAV